MQPITLRHARRRTFCSSSPVSTLVNSAIVECGEGGKPSVPLRTAQHYSSVAWAASEAPHINIILHLLDCLLAHLLDPQHFIAIGHQRHRNATTELQFRRDFCVNEVSRVLDVGRMVVVLRYSKFLPRRDSNVRPLPQTDWKDSSTPKNALLLQGCP